MLESPFANLFEALISRLAIVTQLRFVAQDFGQLENYNIRPEVTFPCALIDIEQFNFSDAQNEFIQIAEGNVLIRLGMVQYTQANNLTPAQWRESALQYYEVEQEVHKVLHGWAPAGFGKMLRRFAATEKRDDDIRIRLMQYAIAFTDHTASPSTIKINRPGITLGVEK